MYLMVGAAWEHCETLSGSGTGVGSCVALFKYTGDNFIISLLHLEICTTLSSHFDGYLLTAADSLLQTVMQNTCTSSLRFKLVVLLITQFEFCANLQLNKIAYYFVSRLLYCLVYRIKEFEVCLKSAH